MAAMGAFNREMPAAIVGRHVVGADGEELGRVVCSWEDTVVVEHGRFFPVDYFLPAGAIDASDAARTDEVRLRLTCREAKSVGRIGCPDEGR